MRSPIPIYRWCPAFLALLLLACGGDAPLAPPTTPTTPVLSPVPWPAVSGSARIYERVSEHMGAYVAERYVLHEAGTFELQFRGGRSGWFEYSGTFSGLGAAIGFVFHADRRWSASGTLGSDHCLVVEYNIIMALSDFEDGVYCAPSEAQ